MRDSDPADEAWTFERRSALKLTAGLVAGGTFVGSAAASESDDGKTVTTTTYRVKQGDYEVEIEPLSGDVPVEELYDYRLPSEYEGRGAKHTSEGPYYRSLGTERFQRNGTSVMFLYDGPDGLSFVVVHDKNDGEGGGSVTWEVTDVPKDADWLVMDDYYEYADSGERAETNYDNWETDGSDHSIDWTWDSGRTDGGVLGRFGGDFSFTVHPAFNENAVLYGEHYDGKVEDWEVLSGDFDSPERISLDLDAAVTLSRTTKTKKVGDGKKGDGKKGDGKKGDEKKSEEEKRREEIEEKQSEMEKEIEQRRKEVEDEIEQRRKDIEENVETKKADIKSEAEKHQEEISDDAESGGDKGNSGGGHGKPDSVTDVSERFKSGESWNSSKDE